MARYLLILWLRLLAWLDVGNARRRVGQLTRRRGAPEARESGTPTTEANGLQQRGGDK